MKEYLRNVDKIDKQAYKVVWVRDYRGKDIMGKPKYSPYYRTVLTNAQASFHRGRQASRFYKTPPPYKPGEDYGPWQQVKSKVLYLLLMSAVQAGNVKVVPPRKPGYRERYVVVNDCTSYESPWVTASMLALFTGEKIRSLYVLLPRWAKWGYVERRVLVGGYHEHEWGYRILARGVQFIDRFAGYVLPMDRYKREIAAHQKEKGIEIYKNSDEKI